MQRACFWKLILLHRTTAKVALEPNENTGQTSPTRRWFRKLKTTCVPSITTHTHTQECLWRQRDSWNQLPMSRVGEHNNRERKHLQRINSTWRNFRTWGMTNKNDFLRPEQGIFPVDYVLLYTTMCDNWCLQMFTLLVLPVAGTRQLLYSDGTSTGHSALQLSGKTISLSGYLWREMIIVWHICWVHHSQRRWCYGCRNLTGMVRPSYTFTWNDFRKHD